MILQRIYQPNIEEDVKAIFENWPEISYTTEIKTFKVGDDNISVFYIKPNQEDFSKVEGFESKEEAMGAFKTLAIEYGFEELPQNIAILHASFDGDKLFMLLKAKNDDNIERFDQLSVEKLTKKLADFQRVVIYSSAVLTYITDLYPAINEVAYVIPQKLSELGYSTPELKDVAKIYGFSINTPEDEVRLIEKILEDSKGISGKPIPPLELPL